MPGMTILSQLCTMEHGVSHGLVKLTPLTWKPGIIRVSTGRVRTVEKYAYQADRATLVEQGFLLESSSDGSSSKKDSSDDKNSVAMACGLLRMDYSAASAFFSLMYVAPFSSCTSFGVDDGMTVTPFSLFLHVLPSVLGDVAASISHQHHKDDTTASVTDEGMNILRTHLTGRFPLNSVLSSSSTDRSVTYVKSVRDAIQYV